MVLLVPSSEIVTLTDVLCEELLDCTADWDVEFCGVAVAVQLSENVMVEDMRLAVAVPEGMFVELTVLVDDGDAE